MVDPKRGASSFDPRTLCGPEGWSLGALLDATADLLDAEGRPLGERRASSAAKDGVPMELRSCPYADERRGQPMNVSALAQLTAWMEPVGGQITAFHRALDLEDRWQAMCLAVIDQLCAPLRELLHSGAEGRTISPLAAAGHKLAAGYFGAVRSAMDRRLRGDELQPGPEGFLEHVRQSHALIGASEACAGPPHLIERFTRIFFGADEVGDPKPAAPRRVRASAIFLDQLRLATAFRGYDRQMEARFVARHLDPPAALRPQNAFMGRRVAARRGDGTEVAPLTQGALRLMLPAQSPKLRAAIEDDRQLRAEHDRAVAIVLTVLDYGDGALLCDVPEARPLLAADIATHLLAYGAFGSDLRALETSLRDALDLPREGAMRFSSVVSPRSRTLDWCQAALGHRLEHDAGHGLRLRNHLRTVPLP